MNIYGTIRPQIINAIFDFQSPFTVNEIAKSCGLLYKSVKRIVNQLFDGGYLIKESSALKQTGSDGRSLKGRPEDIYQLVQNHKKINELRQSIALHRTTVSVEESGEPTSFYYNRAKQILNKIEAEKIEFCNEDIEGIRKDLKLALKESNLKPPEIYELDRAYIVFQKGRLAYIQGHYGSALSKFVSSEKIFGKYNRLDMCSLIAQNKQESFSQKMEENNKKVLEIIQKNLCSQEEQEEVDQLIVQAHSGMKRMRKAFNLSFSPVIFGDQKKNPNKPTGL